MIVVVVAVVVTVVVMAVGVGVKVGMDMGVYIVCSPMQLEGRRHTLLHRGRETHDHDKCCGCNE